METTADIFFIPHEIHLLIFQEAGWAANVALRATCSAWHQLLTQSCHVPYGAACISACATGSLELLKWLRERKYFCGRKCLKPAFIFGGLEMVIYLIESELFPLELLENKAIYYGRTDVLDFLLQYYQENGWNHYLLSDSSLVLAVKCGHREVIQWYRDHGIVCQSSHALIALQQGNIPLYHWICKTYGIDPSNNQGIISMISKKSTMESVNMLFELGGSPMTDDIRTAVALGNLDILKRIHNALGNNHSSNAICNYAATYGHLHIVKWALENGAQFGLTTWNDALFRNHIPIIKLGLNLHPEFTNQCDFINKLEVLQFMVSHGLVLNTEIFARALCAPPPEAEKMAAWLIERGCPIKVCAEMLIIGSVEILKLLNKHNSFGPMGEIYAKTPNTICWAMDHKIKFRYRPDELDIQVLEKLHQAGLLKDGDEEGYSMLNRALTEDNLAAMKYLLKVVEVPWDNELPSEYGTADNRARAWLESNGWYTVPDEDLYDEDEIQET
jgi:hypothetical protein